MRKLWFLNLGAIQTLGLYLFCFLLLHNKRQIRQLKNTHLLTRSSVGQKPNTARMGFLLAWAEFLSGGSTSFSKLISVMGRMQFAVVLRMNTLLSCWMSARNSSQLREAASRSLPTSPWISAKQRTSPVSAFPFLTIRRKRSAFKGFIWFLHLIFSLSESQLCYITSQARNLFIFTVQGRYTWVGQ